MRSSFEILRHVHELNWLQSSDNTFVQKKNIMMSSKKIALINLFSTLWIQDI